MIAAGLRGLARYATWALVGGGLLGLAAPPLAAAMHPLLIPSILALLALNLTTLDVAQVRATVQRPALLAAGVAWLLVVSPLLAVAVAQVAAPGPLWREALVLTAAAPPILSVAAFAQIVGLRATLALAVMLVATFLVPASLVPIAAMALAIDLGAELGPFLLRAVAMLGLPAFAAAGIRWLTSPRWRDDRAGELAGLGVVLLAVFAVALMDGATARLLAEPGTVAAMVGLAFALNVGLQALTVAVFSPAIDRASALTLGLCAGNRNMGLMLAVTAGLTHPAFVTYVAMYQIPVFLLPALQKPIVARWLAR